MDSKGLLSLDNLFLSSIKNIYLGVWSIYHIYMGQKLQDGKKVLCVSLNSPHSERPPGQTPGLSNLPFWILGNNYGASTHKIFHLPGTILKGLKFKVEIMKNMVISFKKIF